MSWIPTQTPEKSKKNVRPTLVHGPLESSTLSDIRAAVEVTTPCSPGSQGEGRREEGGLKVSS
jgi:hypothetical protein